MRFLNQARLARAWFLEITFILPMCVCVCVCVCMGCRLSQNYKKLLVYKKHCNGFICTVKDL